MSFNKKNNNINVEYFNSIHQQIIKKPVNLSGTFTGTLNGVANGFINEVAVISSSAKLSGNSNFVFDFDTSCLTLKTGSTDESLILSGGVIAFQERNEPSITSGSGVGSLYASSSDNHLYYKDSGGMVFDLTLTGSGGGSESSTSTFITGGIIYGVCSYPRLAIPENRNRTPNNPIDTTRFKLWPLARLDCPLTASKSRIFISSPLAGGQFNYLTAAFYTFNLDNSTFYIVPDSLHYFNIVAGEQYFKYVDVDFTLTEGRDYYFAYQIFSPNAPTIGFAYYDGVGIERPYNYFYAASWFESSAIGDLTKVDLRATTHDVLGLEVFSTVGHTVYGP